MNRKMDAHDRRPGRAATSLLLTLLPPLAVSGAALFAAAVPLEAQTPDGWELRLDRPNADAADVSFRTMGDGLHVTTGPAAILWNPENSVSGEFRARVELTQMSRTAHGEAYGLFIGGENLHDTNQSYLYFLVRQDGSYMITHRAGSELHPLQPWTRHEAVRSLEGEGRLTNELAIEVSGNEVSFHVNGTRVQSLPTPPVETEGIVGLRVNHQLDLHIAGFEVEGR